MTRTTNLGLGTFSKNDLIWDTIETINENMEIIDETFGDFLDELDNIIGGA